MSIFQSITNFISNKKNESDVKTTERVCPNCWGSQEYNNEIRNLVKDPQISVNTGRKKYTFIQNFVVNHINGIRLRSSVNGMVCGNCIPKQEL